MENKHAEPGDDLTETLEAIKTDQMKALETLRTADLSGLEDIAARQSEIISDLEEMIKNEPPSDEN